MWVIPITPHIEILTAFAGQTKHIKQGENSKTQKTKMEVKAKSHRTPTQPYRIDKTERTRNKRENIRTWGESYVILTACAAFVRQTTHTKQNENQQQKHETMWVRTASW